MATQLVFAPDLPASLRWYAHVLDLPADAVRQRFEHRSRVPIENQGRLVAAGPGYLSLIAPANKELTLLEPTG